MAPKRNTAPMMKDVAAEAGVALGTVSKVYNNLPVRDEYREKVLAAAHKLGYSVNRYARGFKTNRTNTVALIWPTLRNPFFAYLSDAMIGELTRGITGPLSLSPTTTGRRNSGVWTWYGRTKWMGSSL